MTHGIQLSGTLNIELRYVSVIQKFTFADIPHSCKCIFLGDRHHTQPFGVLLPRLQPSLMKSGMVLNIVWMVYLTSQISETENQTEDNYLFITPSHGEWL